MGVDLALDFTLEALTDEPERRALLAQGGADYVQAFFTWPSIIDRYGKFLERLA